MTTSPTHDLIAIKAKIVNMGGVCMKLFFKIIIILLLITAAQPCFSNGHNKNTFVAEGIIEVIFTKGGVGYLQLFDTRTEEVSTIIRIINIDDYLEIIQSAQKNEKFILVKAIRIKKDKRSYSKITEVRIYKVIPPSKSEQNQKKFA